MSTKNIVVESTEGKAPEAPAKTDEAAQAAPKSALESLVLPTSDDIDPTYRGKTAADLIEMHRNATKKIGEQGNEVGVWRGLVAELSEQVSKQRVTSHSAADQPQVKVTPDDLVADPTAAISKLVDARIKDALKPVQEHTARTGRQAELDALERDFPGYVQLGREDRFQQWATSGNARKADAQAAIAGDLSAARRLLEAWTDREAAITAAQKTVATQPKATDSGKPQGLEGARKAQTESGGAGGAAPAGVLTGQDIIKLIMDNPDKYRSEEFQKELFAAAKSGRVRL